MITSIDKIKPKFKKAQGPKRTRLCVVIVWIAKLTKTFFEDNKINTAGPTYLSVACFTCLRMVHAPKKYSIIVLFAGNG